MIRVLHVLGGLNLGGAETMVMNLYRAIDRSQIQFDFIIHLQEHQAYEDEIREMGGRIYRFPKFSGKNIFEMRRIWKQFFLKHPEYKILHSHIRSYASVYIPIAKAAGLTTIVHSHSTSNGSGIASVGKAILQYPLRYQADYFFACSKEAGEWLFGKHIVQGEKYHMVPNAIDIEKYRVVPEIRKFYRKELGVENKRVFLHVGRLHPAKNHRFLLELFAAWVKENPDDVLLIVGEGGLRDEIEHIISELGILKSVIILGARNDVHKLMQAADCFLFPSLWEGLPVTVVEAQAAGLPCLVSANVTDDVFISPLTVKLPIDQGIECWISKMRELNYARMDVTADIQKAGFDVQVLARQMQEFYEGIK